jgi:hypothetical protein
MIGDALRLREHTFERLDHAPAHANAGRGRNVYDIAVEQAVVHIETGGVRDHAEHVRCDGDPDERHVRRRMQRELFRARRDDHRALLQLHSAKGKGRAAVERESERGVAGRQAAALHHTHVRGLLEHLHAVDGDLLDRALERTGTDLVVALVPALQRRGVPVGVVEYFVIDVHGVSCRPELAL